MGVLEILSILEILAADHASSREFWFMLGKCMGMGHHGNVNGDMGQTDQSPLKVSFW